MTDRFASRRGRLPGIVEREKVEALLVTGEKNVAYLTGFSGDSTWLLAREAGMRAVSDFRYVTQLEEECPGLDAFIRPPTVKLHEAAIQVIKDAGIRRLGIEGHLVSVELRDQLTAGLEGVELVPVNWTIETELRAIKDADEIAEIRTAIDLAQRGFVELREALRADLTERQVAFDLEHAVRRMGGEKLSFPAIIAVGDRAALPHYRPGTRRIGDNPLLLVDWGAETRGGYKSDLTRTLIAGRITPEFAKVYQTVLRAQQAMMAAIRAGVSCIEADKAGRDVIAEAGYGDKYGHGGGHGIGLDIHEQPRMAPNGTGNLQAGMVVTVEPGIYLPGWGGVRIEDDVLVTEEGCEVLSASLSTRIDDMLLSL
jgi:Xaa-Pro aminopeptidase